jgi:hypothetical protein
VAVGGEDEGDVEAAGVSLGLFHAKVWRGVFGLGLDNGDGDRLGIRLGHDAEDVVHAAAAGGAAVLTVDELNRRGGDLAADEVFGPAAGVEGGIDELGAGIGF